MRYNLNMEKIKNNTGAILYIVATPIGNLRDISERALHILREVDLIAAEDTRHSCILLDCYNIKKPLIAYQQHNEEQQTKHLIEKLKQGQMIALISDAGTPLVSDPGFYLVRRAVEEKIKIVPVPGASALLTALSASGLPSDRFYFIGFLPAKKMAREKSLAELQAISCTLIFYAAPHRIMAVLDSMIMVFGGQRVATIARELTKKFETFYYGSLATVKQQLQQQPRQQKGEFVILVQGIDKHRTASRPDELISMLRVLLAELPLKQAVVLAAKISDESKSKVYNLALTLKMHKESTASKEIFSQ